MKYIVIKNRIISIADILTVRYEERINTMHICFRNEINFCIDNVDSDDFKYLFKILNGRSDKEIENLQQELQRKDNIIKGLKEYLEYEIAEWQDVSDEWTKAQVQEDKIILDKIKELEKCEKRNKTL